MHPIIGYELAQAAMTDLLHQTQRDARAHTARRARRTPACRNADETKRQALFASSLQRSDARGTDIVAEAIRVTLARFGIGGCASRMAQEFGDHPEAATERMRWVRSLLGFR